MGAPAFCPTDEQRRLVHAMAGYGVPQDDIALVIGITSRTMRKHFRHELDVAVIEANTRVAQCLYKQATQPGNIAATIFWLKARAGWREKHPEPLPDPKDDPNKVAVIIRRIIGPDGEIINEQKNPYQPAGKVLEHGR
jgi:thiamine pyrophosphate-dependent acetolactate synthase large subunit-like protein